MIYDFAIAGAGLAGSTLALNLAKRGAAVILIEKTRKFSDRVRGEGMHPWGAAEAHTLDIYDLLIQHCAVSVPGWTIGIGRLLPVSRRELPETTPSGEGSMNFYHPQMQETLLDAAEKQGVSVWRDARIETLEIAEICKLGVSANGSRKVVEARTVVGADGRGSRVRTMADFNVQTDVSNTNFVAGLRMRGLKLDPSSVQLRVPEKFGEACVIFPTGDDSWRVYYVSNDPNLVRPLSGNGKLEQFMESCLGAGAEKDWFQDSCADGPLANFACAAKWVDMPVKSSVALVGDAAGAPDPSWGAGLSMALRDVRLFCDAFDDCESNNEALDSYGRKQQLDFGALLRVEDIYHRALFGAAPDTEEFRDVFFDRLKAGTAPDNVGLGPDNLPASLEF